MEEKLVAAHHNIAQSHPPTPNKGRVDGMREKQREKERVEINIQHYQQKQNNFTNGGRVRCNLVPIFQTFPNRKTRVTLKDNHEHPYTHN